MKKKEVTMVTVQLWRLDFKRSPDFLCWLMHDPEVFEDFGGSFHVSSVIVHSKN